ncbi:MAG: hypothetical protein AAFN08_15680 [Cyanobacteria bacterium J06559_3]
MVDSKPDFAALFQDVAKSWDLPKLYEDITDIRCRPLDETEKAYLRGLLHFGSRTQLAEDLASDPEGLREYLQEHIYPYIGKLADQPAITSSKIRAVLKAKGYFLAPADMSGITHQFLAVGNAWDLPKLYEDLEDIRHQLMTRSQLWFIPISRLME